MFIVHDNLVYYMTCDNDVITEGYAGYVVEENDNGTNFVIYKTIVNNEVRKRKFVLPENTLEEFFQLADKYESFYEQQKCLVKMANKVDALMRRKRDSDMKDICDAIYAKPENYIHFVALNVMKNQFFTFCRERHQQNSKFEIAN